jgi:hypothetical protein
MDKVRPVWNWYVSFLQKYPNSVGVAFIVLALAVLY